jgi:hypothetical protein
VTLAPTPEQSPTRADRRCAACGAVGDEDYGWASHHDDGLDVVEAPEPAFLCEGCAELTFG